MLDRYMNQIILRRDGTVAKVTGHSDGWLLLDGSIADTALPGESLVIDLSLTDEQIRKLAYEFGVDKLQAGRVPDLARKRMAQDNYAYQVLQKIDHPSVEGAYLTIAGINEAERYLVKIKPEKGSVYEMLLSEQSIRLFETEGVLPVKNDVEYKVGDVVLIGQRDNQRVAILNDKRDKEWQILDPVTGDIDAIPLDAPIFPTSTAIAETIITLRDDRRNEIAKRSNLIKSNDSLRAENTILHKQADEVKAADRDNEREKLQSQLELEKKAHESTKQQLRKAEENAAQSHIAIHQMQHNGNGKAGFDAKIIKNTGEAEFVKYWSDGWTCEHMQFTHDGKVMTVWRKYTPPAPDDDLHQAVSISDDAPEFADIHEVDAQGYEFQSAGMGKMPVAVPSPANQVQLGKYGMALMQHGIEKTRDAMDAEVTLAGIRAMQGNNPFAKREITLFLPQAVQS